MILRKLSSDILIFTILQLGHEGLRFSIKWLVGFSHVPFHQLRTAGSICGQCAIYLGFTATIRATAIVFISQFSAQMFDDVLNKSIIRAIASFLNSEGGVLIWRIFEPPCYGYEIGC